MECYSRFGWEGQHDPECPELTPIGSDERREWKAGFDFARKRGLAIGNEHPAWLFGYGRGGILLDAKEYFSHQPDWGCCPVVISDRIALIGG
jgi:hypothetical protein